MPFTDLFTEETLNGFLGSFTYLAVAENDDGVVTGMYTLHWNIPGRCSSIANCSYLVKKEERGRHIGEALVKDSLFKAKEYGFRLMQFNGVVDSNIHARHLYERCGFVEAGVIPKGFLVKDGHYEDMHIFYRELSDC